MLKPTGALLSYVPVSSATQSPPKTVGIIMTQNLQHTLNCNLLTLHFLI